MSLTELFWIKWADVCEVLRIGPGTQERDNKQSLFLAMHSQTHFSQIRHFAGPCIQGYGFPDGKEEGDKNFKVLKEPELHKAGISCGVFYVRICWPELREISGRKQLAQGKGVNRQTARPCYFFLTSLNKRNLELVGPDWEWGEKRVGSLHLERD